MSKNKHRQMRDQNSEAIRVGLELAKQERAPVPSSKVKAALASMMAMAAPFIPPAPAKERNICELCPRKLWGTRERERGVCASCAHQNGM
jgi:hypothetical protein